MVYEGRKDYKCKFCDISFVVANQLKKHIYTFNEGHKYFECDICNQRFTTARYVKRHRINLHGVTIQ